MNRILMMPGFLIFLFMLSIADSARGSDFLKKQWGAVYFGMAYSGFQSNSGNKNGNGWLIHGSISTTVYKGFFVTYQISGAGESVVFMYDIYKPLGSWVQHSVLFGHCFVLWDFCLMPSIGLTCSNGIQRGKWLGNPGEESYEYERESFHTTGLNYALQINTNADD